MFLTNRTVKGALNRGSKVIKLEPGSNEVIVGFFWKINRARVPRCD